MSLGTSQKDGSSGGGSTYSLFCNFEKNNLKSPINPTIIIPFENFAVISFNKKIVRETNQT
jgi:hypothetical protein